LKIRKLEGKYDIFEMKGKKERKKREEKVKKNK